MKTKEGAFYETHRDLNPNVFINNRDFQRIQPHFHQQIEIEYVVEGEKEVIINNKRVVLTKDQLAISDCYDIHAYMESPDSDCTVFIFPHKYINEYLNIKGSRVLSSNFLLEEEVCRQIYRLLCQLKDKENLNELIVKGVITNVLGIIVSRIPFIEKKNNEDINLIKQILMYIEENYSEDLNLEDTADKFGYSKHYFSKIFNGFIRCNFKEYVNHVRLNNVIDRLHTGNEIKPITAAFNCGFNSMQTFYRCFKQKYGITPNAYMEKVAQKKD